MSLAEDSGCQELSGRKDSNHFRYNVDLNGVFKPSGMAMIVETADEPPELDDFEEAFRPVLFLRIFWLSPSDDDSMALTADDSQACITKRRLSSSALVLAFCSLTWRLDTSEIRRFNAGMNSTAALTTSDSGLL